MTYARKKRRRAINWNAFLHQKEYDCSNFDAARHDAMDWVVCPCGQLDASIPRDATTGMPLDEKLRAKGQEFAEQIHTMGLKWLNTGTNRDGLHARTRAKQLLAQIEKRAAHLLSQPTQ